MAEVIPFSCWRPQSNSAAEVAAAPYDTLSRSEAAEEIAAHPLSFLRLDKPAALFGAEVGEYDPCVYERARAELKEWYEQGVMILDDEQAHYFLYRLTQGAHTQMGIMACVSVQDYKTGVIKRHENTRALKETDRIEHIKALEAHTGPVLLTYPGREALDTLLARIAANNKPLYDFVAPDGVHHEFWRVECPEDAAFIQSTFKEVPTLYIADGHHRAAAASELASFYSQEEYPESQYFLALVVSSNEMQVLDYNRYIKDLGNLSVNELLAALSEQFELEEKGSEPYKPQKRGEFGMYVEENWYKLTLDESKRPDDAVEGLDVALLHELILEPLLGIDDPRSNPRIAYVGGIRGLSELSKRANETNGVSFALYPCSLEELFAVADANRLMPPKSTWFEPKPRSGLAIHRITG